MSDNYYFVDSLGGESYNIVDSGGSVLVTLRRSSHSQAIAVRDAMEYTRTEGESAPGSFQEGYDHGYAVGYRQGSDETREDAYAAGRRDYHEELWNREDSWPDEVSPEAEEV